MKQFLIIVGVILVPIIALAHFNNFNENGWGHHMGMNMLNGGGGFMMIIIYAVIIIFLFSFVKDLISRKSRYSDSAIQIIKERFAKGEITQTECQEMKKQVRT